MTPKPSLNHPGNRPQSIEDQIDEPNDPPRPAAEPVAGLNFGKHPRPSQAQAGELARKGAVAAANGLTLIEIRRHTQAKLNQATINAVAYLARGLAPGNLPISTPGMAHRPALAARNAVRIVRSPEAEAAWQAARRALPSRHGTAHRQTSFRPLTTPSDSAPSDRAAPPSLGASLATGDHPCTTTTTEPATSAHRTP